MFFSKEETMPPEELRALQLDRLKRITRYVYDCVPFYRNAFDRLGAAPGSIASLDDLARLPFTRKQDLRDNYPFGMFATPLTDVKELHASSGTSGDPTVVGYTRNDIKLWSTVMARTLCLAGATPDDIVQNAYGYGLFTGGLGMHYGALELGAPVVPMSSGNTAKQLKLMQDFHTTVITCTPSYALFMAEEARKAGIDPRKSSWRIGIFGAEPWTHEMRREIEDAWNIKAMDIYGLSEIIGPGVAQECGAQDGLHIYTDVFYAEIIKPGTGEPAGDGESGELVITTLTKEALPLIRYRTGDIASMTSEPCACGRTLPRISKIRGRTDDMLIVRGINVFPSQIESVLLSIDEVAPHYQLVIRRAHSLDTLEVRVEFSDTFAFDEIRALENLERMIEGRIQDVLSLAVKVKLVEPRSIERTMGKARRVVDERGRTYDA
ncbi:phenylacetate--CoA ligase [bacterium]|nr:phenylacetate--CoA ligase [bacterium]